MIESFMYFGIGFLLAALSVLVVAPLVHRRAVRLTRRRLEHAIPSLTDVMAEKDALRAEFAMSTRRLETTVEQLKTKNVSQLAELGRKDNAINRLKIELGTLRDPMRAAEKDVAVNAAAVNEAEKGGGQDKQTRELDARSALADTQKIEIITLKTQVEALRVQLDGATRGLKAVEVRREAALDEAQRALSEKERELAERMGDLEERSTLADAQKAEIITLKTQIKSLENQLEEAGKELKAVEVRQEVAPDEAQRALSEKGLELSERMRELEERSALVDAQKAEIITLKTKIGELEDRLDRTTIELRRDAAVHEAQHALSVKESELADWMRELDDRASLADAQKIEINTLKTKIDALEERLDGAAHELKTVEDRRDAAVHEVQCVLSAKELELAERTRELNEWCNFADAQKIEIITLHTQVEALEEQLEGATHELKAVEDRSSAAVDEAQHALSAKELELAERIRALDEWSNFVDVQKSEIITLKTKIVALEDRLDGATHELKALEDRRATERSELKATTQKLLEERGEFESFHRRVAELVQDLRAQSTKDKNLAHRAQELEKRLVEQSRLLEEYSLEVKNLRGDLAAARKAEVDQRSEIDARVDLATEELEVEKTKLQAALDRANGDRVRLAYELASLKRQVEETWPAERTEKPVLGEVAA